MPRAHLFSSRTRRLYVCGLLPFLAGCQILGLHIHPQAEHAPPDESAKVEFPSSFAEAPKLSGATARALAIAMDDFLPPGTRPEAREGRVAQCLARWDTFTTSIQQVGDVFFIRFSPEFLQTCAPGRMVLDGGATYAVDSQGRILAIH